MAAVQLQMRRNAEDLQDFLKDMGSWEKEVKGKDQSLLSKAKETKVQTLPPVRGKVQKKNKREKDVRLQSSFTEASKTVDSTAASRISSYDYRAWDKFDVEKAVADVDKEVDEARPQMADASSEDESIEEERKLEQALYEKERGNELFKKGKYKEALERYTTGLEADPYNVLLFANRAMAYLKLEKHSEAEEDCNRAIQLDPNYVKSYARRATARSAQKKWQEAEKDYKEVLRLDPGNKQAKAEIKKLDEELGVEKEQATISAVKRPAYLRSKKPLHRIEIEDVGTGSEDDDDDVKEPKEMEREEAEQAAPILEETVSAESKVDEGKAIRREDKAISQEAGHVKLLSVKKEIELTPPKTAYMFEMTWRRIKTDSQLFYKYLKMIQPKDYPKLFKQSVEDVLAKILSTLEDFYISNGELIYQEMYFLTKISRFNMVIMFLSSTEKKTVQRLIEHLKSSTTSATKEQIDTLAKQFGQ